MKITVDKEYTTLEYVDQVKADIKEFKARYTDGDLLRAFMDAANNYTAYASEIIKCDVKAFPGGDWYDNVTHFCVNMITDGLVNMCRIRFYCDMDLTVNVDTLADGITTYDCRVYRTDVA